MPYPFINGLIKKNNSKIILLILDGLGGLPMVPTGKTELETATTPNMDALAKHGQVGETIPIKLGVTPGSGPAHLALFGYDPLVYDIGRGVLSANGVGISVNRGDIAARGNFATIDSSGILLDRRAGRITSEVSKPLIDKLKQINIPEVDIELALVKEYRFVIIMRGDNLSANLNDSDPQQIGVHPHKVTANDAASEKAADLFNLWIEEANIILKQEPIANSLTLRGFASDPALPSFKEAYGLNSACVAVYPMYKGVSKLVGMDVVDFDGDSPSSQFEAVKENWDKYDFFFVHIKKTDSMGEDGNFDGKVKIIEGVDEALPELLSLNPDVLIITGDHSTPAKLKTHSWHPVPFLLYSPATHISDYSRSFGERECAIGSLGSFPAVNTMLYALGYSNRIAKYGA